MTGYALSPIVRELVVPIGPTEAFDLFTVKIGDRPGPVRRRRGLDQRPRVLPRQGHRLNPVGDDDAGRAERRGQGQRARE